MTQPPPDDPFAPPSGPWEQPQWGPSPYPYPSGPTTSPLAIVALILAFLCFPASIVLAIVALVKIKRSGQDGREMAIAALAVDAVAVVLTVVVTVLAFNGVFKGFDFSERSWRVADAGSTTVGACTVGNAAGGRDLVECTNEHDEEIYWVGTLDEGDFPGESEVGSEGDALCLQHFRSYVGTGYDDSSLDYDFYAPDATEWSYGEHRVVCVILTDGATSSARSSGR